MSKKSITLEIVDLEERIAPSIAAMAAIDATADLLPSQAQAAPDVDVPNLGSAAEPLPPQAGHAQRP